MNISYLADVPEAIPVVAEWLFSEWGQHRAGNSFEKVRGRLELTLNKETPPIIILASTKNNPIGTASLRLNDGIENKPELTPWLASVYVPQNYRGQGIGTNLINHIISIAKQQDFTKLYLRTEDKEDFYKNLGWSTLETLNTKDGITTIMYINIH